MPAITHFEVPADDLQRAKTFYTELFNWEITTMPEFPDYYLVATKTASGETGIGGGIVTNGELVHGFDNNAGEIGHIVTYPGGRECPCGQIGCVEAYASASSTARIATEEIQKGTPSSLKELLETKGEITCKDVYDHLAAGDKLAKEVTDQTAEALAILCVNLLHITAPRRIIFFGGMTGAGDLLLNPVKEFFLKNIWTIKKEKVELCFARLGDDTGIIGTAALARHEIQKAAI